VVISTSYTRVLTPYLSGGGATRPLRGKGARWNFTETSSRVTPQGLGQRSKTKVVPKMARRRGSDAGQTRKRWISYCMMYPGTARCLQRLAASSWDPLPCAKMTEGKW